MDKRARELEPREWNLAFYICVFFKESARKSRSERVRRGCFNIGVFFRSGSCWRPSCWKVLLHLCRFSLGRARRVSGGQQQSEQIGPLHFRGIFVVTDLALQLMGLFVVRICCFTSALARRCSVLLLHFRGTSVVLLFSVTSLQGYFSSMYFTSGALP